MFAASWARSRATFAASCARARATSAPMAAAPDARALAALAFLDLVRDTVDLLQMISTQTLPVTRVLNPPQLPGATGRTAGHAILLVPWMCTEEYLSLQPATAPA